MTSNTPESPRPPFWGWPGWRLFGLALLLGLAQTLWFGLVYGGADWVTAQHSYRVRLHLDAELSVPFVPAAVLGYMSIYGLFAMAPLVVRTGREMFALVATLAAATFCAGVVFLLLPAELLFPPHGELGGWTDLVAFAKRIALTYNLMPSLHVALSAVCVLVFAPRAGAVGKVLLWGWSLVIAASTVLLHQHYLIDVVTGYALAWVGVRRVYRPTVSAGEQGGAATVPPRG